MIKSSLFVTAVALASSAGIAYAGGQPGSIGVGAEAQLSGLSGISANYDAGHFHVGGFFGYEDPSGPGNAVSLGARFFWHVHSTAMSDFGLGGSIGLTSASPGLQGNMGPDRETLMFLEPGFQIRLFLASNVALSFTGGITIGVVDASGVAINGQPNALAGIHYYFF